jgi:large subunit ribosomal protein L20
MDERRRTPVVRRSEFIGAQRRLGFVKVKCVFHTLVKKVQMRGGREWLSAGVLLSYVEAKPSESNEAGGPFSTACKEGTVPRAKGGSKSRQRRKKIMKMAKGYVGGRGRLYRSARETVERALSFAYRDRRVKKRTFRGLWITRIGAAAKLNGLSYSQLMKGLKQAGVELDRKILAELAVVDMPAFGRLAETAKSHLNS